MAKYKIIPSSRTIVQSPISIGHKAEKGVQAIEFDLTAWVETYGSGTATIVMKRWGDSIPYPIALEIDENNKATWTLSDIDTAKAGMAYAQLNYIVGDEVVKKSDIYAFRVMDSLTGEGEPPEAYESWLENLTHLAAEAMAEVLDIEGIVTDKTLTVDGGIADGKATGDALALKADRSTTYTKTEVDTLIESVDVETDTTLSVSGKAADAKTVGDAISEINESLDDVRADLNDVENNLYNGVVSIPLTWEAGGISTTDGTDSTGQDTIRIRSDYFDAKTSTLTINPNVADGFEVMLFRYDSNKTYVGRSSWISAEDAQSNDYAYYRIMALNRTRPGTFVYVEDGKNVVTVTYTPQTAEDTAYLMRNLECSANESESGYIAYNNGNVGEQSKYRYVTIDVKPGMVVNWYTKTNDNAGLCFYRANGTFISGVKATTEAQMVVVPENATICKGTIKDVGHLKDVSLQINPQWFINHIDSEVNAYADKHKYDSNVGNYIDPTIILDKTAYINGYVNNAGAIVESTEYKLSPFVEVMEGCAIRILYVTTAGWHLANWYDENQNFIGYAQNPNKRLETYQTYDIKAPYGAKYMRYTCTSGNINATNVAYVDTDIPKYYWPANMVKAWYEQSYGKSAELFKMATAKPLITIIDDDTKNSEMVAMFHDACVAKDIRGGYAVITSRYTDIDQTLLNTLLGYEEEGFSMLTHCTIQDSKWENNQYDLIREDITRCLRQLRASGFVNYMYWIYPGGHTEPEMQKIAKEMGFKCAVSSGLNTIETTEYKGGRYAIKRCTLEASDKAGSVPLSRFMEMVDEAVACNGWLLITTHFGNGEWDATAIANRFDVLVDYAKQKGMTFATLPEAWAIREPIYQYYEMH